jgi:hypothetical protein
MPGAKSVPAVLACLPLSYIHNVMSHIPKPNVMSLQSWSTYHKLLEVDFLEHRALYTALRALLLASFGAHANPVAMLDLGCGDAMQIAASLRQCGAPGGELRLACYTGVDMSAPALDLAAGYLSFLKPECDVQLVEVGGWAAAFSSPKIDCDCLPAAHSQLGNNSTGSTMPPRVVISAPAHAAVWGQHAGTSPAAP